MLVMTCAIREGAEQKIWKKLKHLSLVKRRRPLKKGGVRMKIGILGKKSLNRKHDMPDNVRLKQGSH